MKLCTSFGTRLGAQVRDFSACFGYFTKWDRNYFEISWDHFEFSLLFSRGINGGYYMAMQRHEISLRVLKNISRVSAPFELSYDEFKVTKCCTKTFCLCWVLRSKIAVICYVTSTFFDYLWIINYGMFTFQKKSADLHHSVTEIIKYVERLLLVACSVFSITLCETLFKSQASCLDELSFLPKSWSAVF